jgi:hypothetical protein
MHQADHVAPGIALLDQGNGALAGGCRQRPDFAQDGLQTDAVFVDGPPFDGCLGEGRRHRAQQRTHALREVSLGLQVGLHMAWAGHPQTCAQTTEVGPAKLTTEVTAETLAHPGGDRPPAPALALRRYACR